MIRAGLLRQARHGKVGAGHGPLSLVPMIDILTILVVYLLVHAADAEILTNPRNVSMPMSVSDLKPGEATVITVTRDALYVNAAEVVSLAAIIASPSPVVEPLRAALERHNGVASAADDAGRSVTVMAEKSLPYPVLRRIVASCAAAAYSKVSFAVVEREQAFVGLPGT
jgi:biopolymer transport protein ExbD